jgi:hypothetical protein
MPRNLTAADVTVTLIPEDYYNPPGMLNVSFPNIAFGDGTNDYPAGGIPLPAMGLLGEFKKEIKRIIITPTPGDGYIYKFDKTNYTIRIYEAPTAGTLTVGANTAGTPTGNLAAPAITVDPHAHNLFVKGGGTIAANDAVGVNGANLVKVNANDANITGAGTDSGVQNTVATGNLANKVVTGDVMANHTHPLSGVAGVGQLVEITGVCPTASLDLMVIGQ